MTNADFASQLFPQYTKSGAAAVIAAADEVAEEHETLTDFHFKVADALGFVETVEGVGQAIIGRDDVILDHVRTHTDTALKHESDCPVWCDGCERYEVVNSCKRCRGSGCGPGAASGAYEPCGDCDGDGRDHQDSHPSPDGYDSHEAYAIATARAAVADPDQEYLCGENGGHVEVQYAIEPDRGGCARAHDSELAGPIDELVSYRDAARLVTRQITYGPWRYVTPEEVENG